MLVNVLRYYQNIPFSAHFLASIYCVKTANRVVNTGLVTNVFKMELSEGSIYIKGQSSSIHDQLQPKTKNRSKTNKSLCWLCRTRISEDSPGGFYLHCRNFLKSHWSWALIRSFLFYSILFLSLLLHNPVSVSFFFSLNLWFLFTPQHHRHCPPFLLYHACAVDITQEHWGCIIIIYVKIM